MKRLHWLLDHLALILVGAALYAGARRAIDAVDNVRETSIAMERAIIEALRS